MGAYTITDSMRYGEIVYWGLLSITIILLAAVIYRIAVRHDSIHYVPIAESTLLRNIESLMNKLSNNKIMLDDTEIALKPKEVFIKLLDLEVKGTIQILLNEKPVLQKSI